MMKNYFKKFLVITSAMVLVISPRVLAEEKLDEITDDSKDVIKEEIKEHEIKSEDDDILENNAGGEKIKFSSNDDFISLFGDDEDLKDDSSEEDEKSKEATKEDASDKDALDEEKLTDEEELLDELTEDELIDDEELEFTNIKCSKYIGGCNITVEGNLPDTTKISIIERNDTGAINHQVEEGLGSKKGYFQLAGFDVKFTYEDKGKTKSFMPEVFGEECKITVGETGRSEELSVFALGDTTEKINIEDGSFDISDKANFSMGIIYDTATSICGKVVDDCVSCNVHAIGDDVSYTTKADENGWYLITDVDYSKAILGCCFQIITE